jgi:hypothetical protein
MATERLPMRQIREILRQKWCLGRSQPATLAQLPRAPWKGAVLLQVQVLPGELSVHPSSYRGGKEGNRFAEALGTWAHLGWVGKPTGRNASEARASLESDVVRVDLLWKQGRPQDSVGATDR